MAEIQVQRQDGGIYRVVVRDGIGTTEHTITVDHVPDAAAGVEAERLVAASFRFLLDREPKESILPSFRLSVIGRYFPEYGDRIGEYL